MSLSNIRVRGFNGFAPLISSRNKEWLIDNPSFSVYRYDVQIGRISIENGIVTLEVFIEGEETFLDALKTDVIHTLKLYPTLIRYEVRDEKGVILLTTLKEEEAQSLYDSRVKNGLLTGFYTFENEVNTSGYLNNKPK